MPFILFFMPKVYYNTQRLKGCKDYKDAAKLINLAGRTIDISNVNKSYDLNKTDSYTCFRKKNLCSLFQWFRLKSQQRK